MVTLRGALAGFAFVFALTAGTAFAQSVPQQTPSSPSSQSTGGTSLSTSGSAAAQGGMPVGPFSVVPGIDLAVGHDDNLFLQATNPRSSDFTVVSPYVRADIKPGPHKFSLGARIDDGRYYDSPADSYTDYSLFGTGDLSFTVRNNLKLKAEWRHGHDARGSTDRAASATPDEYDNAGIDGVYSYGAPGARGRIEINGSAYSRKYTNNRATTAASDRDTQIVGGAFYWRVMPRTELLAQYIHTNIDYSLSTSTQDSNEDRFYVGAKWEATAATTGYAKFGQVKKNFDGPGRQNLSDNSWDVGVRWSPLSYSVFDFLTSKQTNESTGFGDAILTSFYSVNWNHAWNTRFRTGVLASYRKDEFTNAAPARTDDTTSFGLRAQYEFRRWLRFGAEYTYWNRDSNIGTFDYKRNLFLLTVGASL